MFLKIGTRINKRKQLDGEPIDQDYARKLMLSLFPKRNDCASSSDLEETVEELRKFGITTKKQLRLFLKRYRRWLLEVEREPLDTVHQNLYREWYGEKEYLDCIRRQYWFCYPALIRNALEKEFGERYEQYAAQRDQI
jgi:hypothetical protein